MSCGGWVELVLVRHGQTPHNREGRYQGRSDIGLSEVGREQARSLGDALRDVPTDGTPVWCSTLRRSRETARRAFPDRGCRPDTRLDELDFGALEGLTHREAEEAVGERYRRWIRRPEDGAPPGGETFSSLRRRVADWLRELPRERTHLAVTHLGPIQALTSLVLELPPSRARRVKTEPGDWTRLLVPDGHPVLRLGSPRAGSTSAAVVGTGTEGPPDADHVGDATDEVRELAATVAPPPGPPVRETRERLDRLAKPPGSLGHLETVATRLARVLGDPPPRLDRRLVPVFLADHGVARRGVSAYPPGVTEAMCRVFSRGAAASQALAGPCGVEVVPVDVGVDSDERGWEGVADARVRRGTRDLSRGPALDRAEVAAAVLAGARVARELLPADPEPGGGAAAVIGLGEMGIGNTTAASAVAAALTGRGADEVVGPGTGVGGDALQRKRRIVGAAAARVGPDAGPLELLASAGGLEIAAMVGAGLQAAGRGVPVLVDGFISAVSAAVAVRLAPAASDYLVASHRSAEPGHALLLRRLELDPVLDLGLRLGEGTGAVLAAPILDAAGSCLRTTAALGDVTGELPG